MPETSNETMRDHGKVLASWSFPEFIQYKRTKTWYFWMAVILLGLIIFSIFTNSYLFIMIIILVILIMVLRSRRHPQQILLQITEEGIMIGDTLYPYKDIKNFWIIYEPPEVKTLYFDFKAALRPYHSISLENQNPIRIREILLKYLSEDLTKDNESFSDAFTRLLKL